MGALFIGIPVKDIPGWYHINLLHVMMLHIFIKDLKIHPEIFHAGGGFVSGYLPFQLLYSLQLWSSAQRVHIGYTRSMPSLILFPLR